eukprot:COSAG05_NODE_5633_length_1126_cov_0.877313_2_plen_43_part_00
MTSVAPQGWVRPVKMNTNEIDKADAMAAALTPEKPAASPPKP